jgi:hypothetical protein
MHALPCGWCFPCALTLPCPPCMFVWGPLSCVISISPSPLSTGCASPGALVGMHSSCGMHCMYQLEYPGLCISESESESDLCCPELRDRPRGHCIAAEPDRAIPAPGVTSGRSDHARIRASTVGVTSHLARARSAVQLDSTRPTTPSSGSS